VSSKEEVTPNRPQAFLIVDGTKVIIIDKDSFRIGRKKENDVIIDSPHVSRHHAKIRFVQDKYILFDMESTVGTSVNGKPTQTTILKPGDVISVGGVPVIFGMGTPDASRETSQPTNTITGPTDSTELEELDDYLDHFEDKNNPVD